MIICIDGDKISKHDTLKILFNELTKTGDVVFKVEDGIITLIKSGSGDKVNIEFFKPNIIETKDDLILEVVEFRNSLRENINALKESGLIISKEEIDKLSAKFEFVKSIK